MVSWVAKYFQENDFEVKEHCIHQGMKVHVYAYKELKSKKSKGKKKYDEVIVEVSVSEEIPPKHSSPPSPVTIILLNSLAKQQSIYTNNR